MNRVRAAVAVSLIGLALYGAGAERTAIQAQPPATDMAPPSPLPLGTSPAPTSTDLQIPEVPGKIPDPVSVHEQKHNGAEAGSTAPPPIRVTDFPPAPAAAPPAPAAAAPAPLEQRPKAPALPAPFRVLTSDPAPLPSASRAPLLPSAPPTVAAPPLAPPAAGTAYPLPATGGPWLVVEKRGPVSVRLGYPLSYDVVVRNIGSAPATQVHLQDEVPAGTKLINTSPPAITQGTHLVWILELLPRGTEARFRVELQAMAPGDVSSRACLINSSEEVRTNIVGTGLVMTVAPLESVSVGQPVPLKVRIVNQQPVPVRKMKLVGRLPDGLQHQMGKEIEADLGDLEAGATKTVDLTATAARPGQCFAELVLLDENGQQTTAQAAVLVQPGMAEPPPFPGGPPLNNETGPAPTPAAGTQKPPQREGELVVLKMGQKHLVQGQQTEYRLEVVNKCDADAINVVVQDKLPVGLDFVSASKGLTYDPATRTVVWAPGLLAPHQTINGWITVAPKFAGELINAVSAQADNRTEAKLTATLAVRRPSSFFIPGLTKPH